MLTQQLQNAVGERAVILSANWTAKIVKSDSANNLQYLSRLNRQIDGEYFLVGLLSSTNVVNQVKYQMIDSKNNKAVLNDSVEIIPEQLPNISWKVSKEILQYFKVSPLEEEKNVRLIKSDSYQKFLTAQGLFQKKEYTAALNFAGQSIANDSSMIEAYLLAGKSNFMMALKQKKEGKSPVDYFQRRIEYVAPAKENIGHVVNTPASAITVIGSAQPKLRRADAFIPGKGIGKKKHGLSFLHHPVDVNQVMPGMRNLFQYIDGCHG